MSLLKIATVPQDEEFLRRRCAPVLKLTPRLRKAIDDMVETMYAAAGVGLAAPQVFLSQRFFVYDVGDGAEALINPEVLEMSGEEVGQEGCLSIPRLHGDVVRAERIVVTGLNRGGKRVRIEATDYLARVFQHEIDHLNGVLFTDLAIPSTLHLISEEEEAERRAEAHRLRREQAAAAAG